MIKSILDNDLYKFSMSYAYMKLYPEAEGVFEFHDRKATSVYTQEFLEEFNRAFKELSDVFLMPDEKEWCIKNIPYIPECYWEWLSSFKYDTEKVHAYIDDNQNLHITVADKLYKATFYEVPILALVSETYNKIINKKDTDVVPEDTIAILDQKLAIAKENHLPFSEFGTRRRFSSVVQDAIVKHLKENAVDICQGTSNVYFAMKYGMKPIGTVAHEWVMFHGAQFGYKMANYEAYEAWVKVYDGNLGIALTDTYSTDMFFKNFSMKQAKLFDGIRQDSGDEAAFVDKAIKRYTELGIDPKTKTIIFSNGLSFYKYWVVSTYCEGKIKFAAGIGTNLTNDVGVKPLNIVMKLSKCRMNAAQVWYDCIKLSDDEGKETGSQSEIDYCKSIIKKLHNEADKEL